MTKRIKLTQGRFSLIDDSDYERVSKHKWCVYRNRNVLYSQSRIDGKVISMHQFILGKTDGLEIDHINRDGLDNRNTSSGFCGVYRVRNKWRAMIRPNGKRFHLGYFDELNDAVEAYRAAAQKLMPLQWKE